MSITRRVSVGAPARTAAELVFRAAARLAAEGFDDPRLEAEVLLAHALGIDRSRLLARLDEPAAADGLRRFDEHVTRRLAHEPIAYITGMREFYGMALECSAAALIPRPETEMLVDFALAALRLRHGQVRVVDVGTGTGAVALAIARHAPDADATAVDTSAAALALAARNADRLRLADRVRLERRDLLEGTAYFDLVVANLPYLSEAQWNRAPREIRDYEPRAALVGGADGTEVIERLLTAAPAHLAAGGVLVAEIGETQGARLQAAARRAFPASSIDVARDLAGLDRVITVR